MRLKKRLKDRWSSPGGYRELLMLAFPLIMSSASWAVLNFIDRMLLTWYSNEALAASMPAGILNFTVVSLFLGTANYIGTFTAQYLGAGEHRKIGPALWQGLYIALCGSLLIALLAPLSKQLFAFTGHEVEVQRLEAIYFSVLCLGAAGPLISSTMGSLFAGLGRPMPIMWGNILSTIINIILDYLLIFGKFGFPQLGILGAALATVIAGFIPALIYGFIIFSPTFEKLYATVSSFRPDLKLIRRILKFGLPNGLHLFLDIAGFTGFILILGRLGKVELATTNMAFNINSLAFMPMIGMGIAISMLVGRNIGARNPAIAKRSVYSALHLSLLYMGLIALAYWFIPELFIFPFAAKADPAEFTFIAEKAPLLLKFVAVYCLFDTVDKVFSAALKGAGDTRFVMGAVSIISLGALLVPAYLALEKLGGGLLTGWTICTLYIVLLSGTYLIRFLLGRWQKMSVIRDKEDFPAADCPEAPLPESEF